MDNTADLKKQIEILEDKLQKEYEKHEELATTFAEQVEEIDQLQTSNREWHKLCQELKENEEYLKSETRFNEAKLVIGLFIGGILMYLFLNCFIKIDDWAYGMPFWKILCTILIKALVGAVYSFSYLAAGELLFILIKSARNKKSVAIRMLLVILLFFICMTIKSLLF